MVFGLFSFPVNLNIEWSKSWMKQILYTCETIYIWLDYRKEWTRVLAHSRQKRMSPWLCPCDLPTFSVPSSPTTALPACLVSGTMCRRRDYQMEYPESIILGFMEFTYFYLIIYLYSSFNCALSENLWITTPTVKHNNVIGFLRQLHFVIVMTGNQDGWLPDGPQSGRELCVDWLHGSMPSFLPLHLTSSVTAMPCAIPGDWGAFFGSPLLHICLLSKSCLVVS